MPALVAGMVVAVALVGAAALTLLPRAGTATGGESAADRLPDLVPQVPSDLSVTQRAGPGGPRFLLGFRAAADNLGAGPLIVDGHRTDRPGVMAATQVIRRADGTERSRPLPSELRYVISPDHRHWHWSGFMRYELRARDGRPVARGAKTGFCLGDRYRARSPAASPAPRRAEFPGRCGTDRPGLGELRTGISVGHGDAYAAHLEGQHIDVTGLPAGRYRLVHTADPERVLAEAATTNDTAAVDVTIAWPRGPGAAPTVSGPGSASR